MCVGVKMVGVVCLNFQKKHPLININRNVCEGKCFEYVLERKRLLINGYRNVCEGKLKTVGVGVRSNFENSLLQFSKNIP